MGELKTCVGALMFIVENLENSQKSGGRCNLHVFHISYNLDIEAL